MDVKSPNKRFDLKATSSCPVLHQRAVLLAPEEQTGLNAATTTAHIGQDTTYHDSGASKPDEGDYSSFATRTQIVVRSTKLTQSVMRTSPTHVFFCPSEGRSIRSMTDSNVSVGTGTLSQQMDPASCLRVLTAGVCATALSASCHKAYLSAEHNHQPPDFDTVDDRTHGLTIKLDSVPTSQINGLICSPQPTDETKLWPTRTHGPVPTPNFTLYGWSWQLSSVDLPPSHPPTLPLFISATSRVLGTIRPMRNRSNSISTRTMFWLGFVPGLWFCFFLGGWELGMQGRVSGSHRVLPMYQQRVVAGEIVWKHRCRVAAGVSSVLIVGFVVGALLLAVSGT